MITTAPQEEDLYINCLFAPRSSFLDSSIHHPLFEYVQAPEIMEVDDSSMMSACGLFRRRRKTSSTSSKPRIAAAGTETTEPKDSDVTRRRPTGSDQTSIVPVVQPPPPVVMKSTLVPVPNAHSVGVRRSPEPMKALPPPPPPPKSGNGILADLDSVLYDWQRAKGGGSLVRASSGNLMVCGNLGNLRGNSNNFKNPPSWDLLAYLPKTAKEPSTEAKERAAMTTNPAMGNIMKTTAKETTAAAPAPEQRLEAEEMKETGNEEYKNGRFAEAVALYDRAIAMDRGKASYYSNKAAALTGMGRLLEAVDECKEAIRIDPAYNRAHHRLATLYLRLGEAEKATHHFKLSKFEASPNDISRAQALQSHLTKSNEARKFKDYITMLKESTSAASSGADSAPQVFALRAEALLKLHRHDEADSTLSGAPQFSIDESTKFFGATPNAYFLVVQAQVDMASGRYEDAVARVQRAAQLDPSNREITAVLRRTKAVASARLRGNELFRAAKFAEACVAYGEGLNHDSHNAILLCNRAACCFKLGYYEKAIEDCNAALVVCPSYRKARRRRADCNAKLERWETSMKDYQVLVQEMPGDEEVSRALSEAQAKLKKHQDGHVEDTSQS
ncbi:inactive TPR repeat-containing thioredoxin TTL3 [Canna indica]|uniref:Inactive TPR repeat-containing thioredoxin TTL3 n=1 Tax=Canna indica TaxID=4628 RepID=A0AAQ3KDB9_9LILI|nr:inactive TPR repeat-containing thioredoxin TTL3 [Canna indica]